MARKQEKFASNTVLAGLVVLTIIISLIGTLVVQVASTPHNVPVGTAKVSVNVAQSPSRPLGEVKLFVLPKLG